VESFSGLTGFAGGFWSLFLCRLMVGVGEATLGPAALSLREAKRGQTEGATAPGYTSRDWKVLFKTSALRYHYAGYALFGLASNQLSIWGRTSSTVSTVYR